MSDYEEIRDALACVPPYPRDRWLKMGMALKSELGDELGFDLFDQWSQGDETYNERDAKAVWRSFKSGGVTIKSLFGEARDHGYKPKTNGNGKTNGHAPDRELQAAREKRRRDEEALEAERRQAAQQRARTIWEAAPAATAEHPYLQLKGIRDAYGARLYSGNLSINGMGCDGALVVPVRDSSVTLHSLQFITAGVDKPDKRNLPDGRMSGCYFSIGKAADVLVIAEGFATGASIHEVCGHGTAIAFNAGNLLPVAKALREKRPDVRIVIAADNDIKESGPNTGLEKAYEAARAVGGFVAVPELNGEKCDFNDVMLARGADAVRQMIQAAREPPSKPPEPKGSTASECPAPVPLVRVVPPAAEYPVDALGPVLAPAARALSELVQVPFALAGNSVLAAAALAAQAHGNVQGLGGLTPLSLYALSISESGGRKTATDNLALKPIHEYRNRLEKQYVLEMRKYKALIEAHKAKVRTLKEDKDITPDDLATALEKLSADEPPEPRRPLVLAQDPTPEGIFKALKRGQFSQGLFTNEGASFIGGHALSEEAELRTIAMLSILWQGEPIGRCRGADDEHTTLYGRRFSVHLMAQTSVANRLLGNPLYRAQGILARFCSPHRLACSVRACCRVTRLTRRTTRACAATGEGSGVCSTKKS